MPQRCLTALPERLVKCRAILPHQKQITYRPGVTLNSGLRSDLSVYFRGAHPIDQAAHFLWHLANNLGNPLAEADTAPLGKAPLHAFALALIGSHILGASARKGADQLVGIREVIFAIV